MKKRRSGCGTVILIIVGLFIACAVYGKYEHTDYTVSPDAAVSSGGSTKYYYDRLSSVEQHAYNMILDSVWDFPDKIKIPDLTQENLGNVFEALFYDNQTLFFLSKSCTARELMGTPYFFPEYTMTKTEYQKRMAQVDKVTESVKELISGVTDEYERELIIHDYLVNNCAYDSSTAFNDNNLYSALVLKKVLCEGYSMAIKQLLESAGIECYIVTGTSTSSDGSTDDHMWNTVKIDGKYYYLDATWNDPLIEGGEDVLRHFYFNATDDDISVTHSDYENDNRCTSREANYYVRSGQYFTSYSADTRRVMAKKIAETVSGSHYYIEFKFSTSGSYNTAVRSLFDAGEIYGILKTARQLSNSGISVDSVTYTENKGYNIITLEN